MDLVVAAATLMVAMPIFIMVGALILLFDGRPIFYRQTRVGRNGVPFEMLKFRTMVPDAHTRVEELVDQNERGGPLFKISDDPRVTRIGKFLRRSSIDELPQLINILFGSMSLVGPRPCLPTERENFSEELLARETMPQGLTGEWQLQGRHDNDFGVYRELDLHYIRNWSLRRDLWILVRTPFVVFAHAFVRSSPAPETKVRTTTEITIDRTAVPNRPAIRLEPIAVAADD